MSNITGSEPAMPIVQSTDNSNLQVSEVWSEGGLTIRQELAARAMAALIIAKPDQIQNPVEGCQLAMLWADEMINQFNKS